MRRAPQTDGIQEFDAPDYGLQPVRMATWQGFIFINLAQGKLEGDRRELLGVLSLSGVHPQLNRLSPSDRGHNLESVIPST